MPAKFFLNTAAPDFNQQLEPLNKAVSSEDPLPLRAAVCRFH